MANEQSLKKFDELIKREIVFNKQDPFDKGDSDGKDFELLLLLLLLWAKKKKPLNFLKKKIKDMNLSKKLLLNLIKGIEIQSKIILNKKKNIDLNKNIFNGFTINELIKIHKTNVEKNTIIFANNLQNIKESEYDEVFDREIEKYKNSRLAIFSTIAAAKRFEFEEEVDKKIIKRHSTIKGWTSIAVLDRRTSPMCAGLHGKFYPYIRYKSRSEIPNPPPRHPRCRSLLYIVENFENEKDIVKETLESFFKRNPDDAKQIIGENKYRLFRNNKIKIKNFYDLKKYRFFTNEEIVNKFNFKTKHALRGVDYLKQSKIVSKEAIKNIPRNLHKNTK